MRGLTDQERAFMLSEEATLMTGEPMVDYLERRGLLADGPWVTPTCVQMVITPVGALALRLDAAARACGGTDGR